MANYVDSLKVEFRQKTNKELSEMTNILIDRLKRGQSLDDVLPEALATAREAIYRVHHIFAYKVQLIGAIVANYGDFAEMYTGEGKTIVIVTHSLDPVKTLCDRAVWLYQGEVRMDGKVDKVLDEYLRVCG